MKITYHNDKAKTSKRSAKIHNGGNAGPRFQGNMKVNTREAARSIRAEEPDWFSLDLPDLLSARRQVKARKGEPRFKGVEARIQRAIDAKVATKVKLGTPVI